MLCREYGLTEQDIICHSEGSRLGIASNHADVMHWFLKHGENMDTFRAAVGEMLRGGSVQAQKVRDVSAGDIVQIKKTAVRYYLGGPVIPDRVKGVYHQIAQVYSNGRIVEKGGKHVYS